jgi:hypothetical protein
LLAAHDMDRLEFAALDTLQHGRARNAERAHRFAHWHEAIAGFAVEAGHEVIGEPDAPGGAGGQLLAGDDPVIEQAMDGRWRNAKRDRGFLDRQQLALGRAGGRLEAGNVPVAAQIADAARDEAVTIWVYLNMPLMTETKKITAATKSNPATIFLLRVTLRGRRRGSNLEDRIFIRP